MSDHEVIPYVKLPLKPGRVKPTSGQQVEADSLSWNFYALTECVYFLIQEVMGKPESLSHLEKRQTPWMLFWTVFQLSKATWFSTAGLEDLQD